VRDSERDFRTLIDAVTDYAIFRLTPDGTVATWNAGAERAKGYRADEIIGQNFRQFYTPEDQAAHLPERLLAQSAREGRSEIEGWRVRKDSSRFWANVVIDPIYDENGNLDGFAKITRDITERRDAQLALQRTQEQLAQAQKMDALGQLTGGIAHDFNNMLMVVSGYTQYLKQRLHEPKDKRAIEAIEFAASRAENLTRQLLTFSRRQSLNRTTARLLQVVSRHSRHHGQRQCRARRCDSGHDLAGQHRRQRIRGRDHQSDRQCPRRDAAGRPDHNRGA
jgi:PAS domain S-box-containing protein